MAPVQKVKLINMLFEQYKLDEYAPLAARVLLGGFLMFQGLTKLTGGFSGFSGFVEGLGIPAATVVAALVVLIEIAGGLALLTGFRAKSMAVLLAGYLVLVNLVAHQFWSQPDQLSTFMKNLGLIGGLLAQSALQTGRYSVDSLLE